MKRSFSKISTVLLILFSLSLQSFAQHKFEVNLNDRADDHFNVTLYPNDLTKANDIYQFAAIVPGTYQIADIGRFVHNFHAYDRDGNEISVTRVNTNQWKLSDPLKVTMIKYQVTETWDTTTATHIIYPMAGSSLEKDHTLINGQCVFGYFHGMQKYPMKIKLDYPQEWTIGTALYQDNNGYYEAEDFDKVVDSPILLGRVSKAEVDIAGTQVRVFTYSKTDIIKSQNILTAIEDILNATNDFLGGLPVDRYTFLFHFENFTAGAWEHSYSSEYVYKESPLNDNLINSIRSTVAHEFFHIITPLNIHSELIEDFNFENPELSRHLWMYEGMTEWASDKIQLMEYLITPEEYLHQIQQKLNINDQFDPDVSLTTLGKEAIKRAGEYFNIYNKGAVVCALLDIKLLDLSHGKMDLRKLIVELSKDYGPHKSISEEHFFDDLVQRTFPEIRNFIDNYIKGTKSLPVGEYFDKIGIGYQEFAGYDSSEVSLGIGFGIDGNNIIITYVQDKAKKFGLQKNDILYKLGDEKITLKNAQAAFSKLGKPKVGDEINSTVLRDGKEVPITVKFQPQPIKHVFTIKENPTDEETTLKNAWMGID